MLPYIFALLPVGLALGAIVWSCRATGRHRLLQAALCGSVVALAFLAGPWAFTSYYLRYAIVAVFALSLCARCHRGTKHAPTGATAGGNWPVVQLLFLLLFCLLDALALAAFHQPGNPLNLAFPLKTGRYYVLQGGNSAVTNPFHALGRSFLALDIVKLNRYGNRAEGIAPRTLSAYEIYGESVYSPCDGTVSVAQDGLPDNLPGQPDPVHPAGNHIVLKCGEAEILLAHLKSGSIATKAGAAVASGTLLARVGNSGNTIEPHLHISATSGGQERGLAFQGRTLSVNSLINQN